MKLLLDSHVLLWAIDRPELLSRSVQKALQDETNELVVSVASIWEITLKVQAGKLVLPETRHYLQAHFEELGVQRYLPVDLLHVQQVGRLPQIHKDSFDRILLAQAMVEGLTAVSKDEMLLRYAVPVLW